MEESKESDICLKECKYIACEIQSCLFKNNYKQNKCLYLTNLWNNCCKEIKEKEFFKEKEKERN